jgi:hypothetical protein
MTSTNLPHAQTAKALHLSRQALDIIAQLQGELADVRADRDAYRELLQLTLAQFAELETKFRRQTTQYHQLLDERRRERQQRMVAA